MRQAAKGSTPNDSDRDGWVRQRRQAESEVGGGVVRRVVRELREVGAGEALRFGQRKQVLRACASAEQRSLFMCRVALNGFGNLMGLLQF